MRRVLLIAIQLSTSVCYAPARMAARKKKKRSSKTSVLAKLAGATEQVSPSFVLAMLLAVLLAIGLTYSWRRWGGEALARADRRLQPEGLQVTPQPDWIDRDVAVEVFRDGSLGELSLLDNELTYKVYKSFKMHPWVADVNRVGKRTGGQVVVDLQFRRPVAWVEIPAEMTPFKARGVFPVDREAVLLPTADLQDRFNHFPLIRIAIPRPEPWGLEGQPWGDPRIAGAALIAEALQDSWRELGLHWIRLAPNSGNSNRDETLSVFEVASEDGATFVWGSAPGAEQPGEMSASEKVIRLRQEVQRSRLSRRPGTIDLRSANSPSQPAR